MVEKCFFFVIMNFSVLPTAINDRENFSSPDVAVMGHTMTTGVTITLSPTTLSPNVLHIGFKLRPNHLLDNKMKLIIPVLKRTPPLHPNPCRQGLMKKVFLCLCLSTPTNIEVAKDVINVSQSEQELPLDFTVRRGTARNASSDFIVVSKKQTKKKTSNLFVCM